MIIANLARKIGFHSPSPLLKQAPTAVLVVVALTVIGFQPDWITNVPALIAGIGTAALATALAAVMTTKPSLDRFILVIPAIDFAAAGLLRYGTGEGASIFTALLVLPVVWFAAEEGREFVIVSFIGTAMALLFPSIAGVSSSQTDEALLRAGFIATALTVAAAVINELSHQARLRLASVRDLAEQRRSALESNLEQTKGLEKSEASLRLAQRQFVGLWDAVTEQSLIGTDITGIVDAWNPGATKMLGVTADEVQHRRHVDEFHLTEELEERAKELNYPAGATVLNPGFSALVEPARLGNADVRDWTYVRPDGRLIPVELSVTPRFDEVGEIVGYLFVAYDVTKAREVARLKDEFVGLISHELRTPLSSILGYLELLRDDDDAQLSDDQLQYLGVAERNAHRLLRLVGDLLFTAQVESGKFNLDLRNQDLAPIVSASVESARPLAAAAGISLRAELPEGSHVHGDAVRLGQACDNLISNAIKFTPKGGAVTVALNSSGANAVVTVSDTGMGIAESELDQLFSRFFRATTATRNAVPGVGLGLTITKAIVTAHGGDMSVTSEEGVGTTFSLSLPVVQPALV